MLFTVGTGYFMFVNQSNLQYTQALSNRANSLQSQLGENVALSGSASTGSHLLVTAVNSGGQATTIVGLFIVSPSGLTQYLQTTATTPPLPIPLNPGATSVPIDTGITIVSGTYVIKAVTQRGATFSVTYPPTAIGLAAQALSSGAIGDLYLTFQSFTYYIVTNVGCPSGTGYSTYCLQTTSGNTGSGFVLSASATAGKMLAFSMTLTDLNSQQYDIVLDQFTLIYQNAFYGNQHTNFIPWYVATTGTPSGGLVPVLTQYQPIVLRYNVPTTVYFISSSCVQASQGPNDGCLNFAGAPMCNSGNGGLCNSGTATTIFILSNGWELAPGSYAVSSLQYSQVNYGQNSPFVSTLFY